MIYKYANVCITHVKIQTAYFQYFNVKKNKAIATFCSLLHTILINQLLKITKADIK